MSQRLVGAGVEGKFGLGALLGDALGVTGASSAAMVFRTSLFPK